MVSFHHYISQTDWWNTTTTTTKPFVPSIWVGLLWTWIKS